MKSDIKMKLKLSDQSRRLLDKVGKDDTVSKLTVSIEATHSGIINGNKWFYTPAGMEDGASTFTSPFPKPVLVSHDRYADAVGRVIESEYVPYSNASESGIGDSLDSKSSLKQIKDFTKSDIFAEDGYKGLGHIELKVEITDTGAIEKLLDNRYLTVSISGDTEQAVCSTCGIDAKNIVDNEEPCEHWRGEIYDEEESFLIAGAMTFNEVSFVNVPADSNAKVKSIQDGLSLVDSIQTKELEILDFVINKKGDTNLKIKITQLTSDAKLQDSLDAHLETLGLGDGIQKKEDLAKLRKSSFLFADSRQIPLNSKHALIAAYHALDNVEDSSERVALITVLDTRWKKAFGALSMEDAIKSLGENTDNTDNTNSSQAPKLEVDHDAIADKVIAGMKSLFDFDDSFLASRNRQLEEDLLSVVEENSDMLDKLRAVTISQIIDKEGKSSIEGYRESLSTRSLESLTDKLTDLTDAADESSSSSNGVTDPNVSIDDAAEHGTADAGDASAGAGTDSEDPEPITAAKVRDEYRRLMKKEGLSAASMYLKDLRETKKMPKDFAFK